MLGEGTSLMSFECLMGQLCSLEKHPVCQKSAKVREKRIQDKTDLEKGR